jgi:hypothetical protein
LPAFVPPSDLQSCSAASSDSPDVIAGSKQKQEISAPTGFVMQFPHQQLDRGRFQRTSQHLPRPTIVDCFDLAVSGYLRKHAPNIA